VVSSRLIKSSKKGTPGVCIEFDVENQGMISYFGYITDRSWEYTDKALKALGFDVSQHGGDIGLIDGTDLLANKRAFIVCDEDTLEDGKVIMKVQWVNSIDGGGGGPLDDGEKRQLVERIRELSGVQPDSVVTEDDTPF
jgi:hypothetical protein